MAPRLLALRALLQAVVVHDDVLPLLPSTPEGQPAPIVRVDTS